MSIIAGAMQGAGEAGVKAGLEYQKQAGDVELEKTRNEMQGAREQALERARQEGQVNLEQNVRQPFERGQQEARFGNENTLLDKRIGADKDLQTTRLEAAAKERVLDRDLTKSEGTENRAVQREGQAIHARQVGIMEKTADLDRDIKTIELKNKKDLDKMRADYAVEPDPSKRAQIADNIHILTGKDTDKYLPVPLKDDMGNVTGYQIFDRNRGQFVDQKLGSAASTGAKWDNGTGSVMVDGKVIGQAKTESEARALLAKHRQPAGGEKPAAKAAPTVEGEKTPGQAFRQAVANTYDPNKAIGGLIGSRIIPPEESYTAP